MASAPPPPARPSGGKGFDNVLYGSDGGARGRGDPTTAATAAAVAVVVAVVVVVAAAGSGRARRQSPFESRELQTVRARSAFRRRSASFTVRSSRNKRIVVRYIYIYMYVRDILCACVPNNNPRRCGAVPV